MAFTLRRLQRILWISPRIYSGTSHRLSAISINLLAARSTVSLFNMNSDIYRRPELAGSSFRCSTVSESKNELLSMVDVLSFIKSSLHEPEGPSHCWLNKVEDRKNLLKEDGIFLIIVSEYLDGAFTSDTVKMFEKIKSLYQRYPFLEVLALQCGRSICVSDISTHLLHRIIKEYVTFPILLSNKNFFEMVNGPCCIVSKGLQNPLVYPEKDVSLEVLDKVIQDMNVQNSQGAIVHDMESSWVKPIEVVKEPAVCSASRNLLFSFPGCISVDERGNRLFLSDVNHHRIIVFDSKGKILDAIGSFPGFVDGAFESAKLMRPAASFYDASEDCLYFVDSENHAIRRADMDKRVVETVFPATDGSKKNKGFWKWILNKLWTERNVKLKSEEFSSESFLFPWHLLKSSDNSLFVLNQSFGTLWIVDLESGSIREVIKGSSKILEICGQMILEKLVPLTQMPSEWLQQQLTANCSFEGIPYAGLMSSVATFQDHVIFCDTVGQMVVKSSRGSGSVTSFPFSNFGTLGLPYWFLSPLEQVYSVVDMPGIELDHLQYFKLLPGRVDIELTISIPQQTDLVELPQEGCIWRQARGTAAEVSGVANKAEKVGIAQQWYDELDNLCYSTPLEESSTEEESRPSGKELQEGVARVGCTINTSPGTSEVIICAALYLRLKKSTTSSVNSRENRAATIANILNPKKSLRRDLLVKLITSSNRDPEELIFMRPLHVRLKLDSLDHPKADNNLRDTILSESSVKVHVVL